MPMLDQLVDMLVKNRAVYRIVEHVSEGRSEAIAKIRGSTLEQGAKAIVLSGKSKLTEGKFYILAVLPSQMGIDMKVMAKNYGVKSMSFAPADVAETLTGCVMGSVPPFSFDSKLKVAVDPRMFELNRGGEIVFNAGSLEHSIFLKTEDYVRIIGEVADIFEFGKIQVPSASSEADRKEADSEREMSLMK